jgi:signal transduction histidine kinase
MNDAQWRRPDDAIYEELSRVNNELANLQREMVRANAQLTRLNEQKNEILGMAAHDLRNPLGVVLSYSEFLESEGVLSAEQREFVAAIRTASHSMLHLVNDLLDVTQIEAGTLRLDRQPTDLAALVRRNAALNQILASRRQVKLEVSAPDVPLLVPADVRKIEQVLNNLIGNAVKHSPAGGCVQVRLHDDPRGAQLQVRDHGRGMTAEDLGNLFQPFRPGSLRSISGERATGLGLAIVQRIVQGHGGRIEVESAPGAGSTFTVTLPRESARQ